MLAMIMLLGDPKSYSFILLGLLMCETKMWQFTVDVEIFYWISYIFDLLVALGGHQRHDRVFLPRNMNIYTTFYGNPSANLQM